MTAVDALQSALAGEHAAVYGYEVITAPTDGNLRRRLARALDEHRAARDSLRARIVAQGATPVSAEPGYVVPGRTDAGDSAAIGTAALIEGRLGVVYASVIEEPDATVRRVGLTGLRECTVRASSWTGVVQDLPGIQQPSSPRSG
jgi:hypothetical protein